MIDILVDIEKIVDDAGLITRVEYEGLPDVIKVIQQTGYVYYVATPDRDDYEIILVDELPEDWQQYEYYYINGEFIKRFIPTGSTENIIYSGV
jgi:hypothetical protein